MFILQNTDKTHFLIFKVFGQWNKESMFIIKNEQGFRYSVYKGSDHLGSVTVYIVYIFLYYICLYFSL